MDATLSDAPSLATEPPQTYPRPMLAMAGMVKSFGANHVLRGISLSVAPAEAVVVIGPSGSGKTTLLRCINMLEDYQEGTVTVDGEPVGYRADPRTGQRQRMSEREIAAAREHIGIVFQSYNLFPHMTALQNIVAAPIRVKGVPRARAEARGAGTPGSCRIVRQSARISGASLRRAAATGGDRAGACDGSEDHAVR